MTLGWCGGHFLFGWAVRSHQWIWDWVWCTSNTVWSFLFFCSCPHIWSFSVIKLSSFHTLSHLLTENLSVHMIINCYLQFLNDINRLIVVKVHGILKRWNVLFIISHYIEKNKLKKVSNSPSFQFSFFFLWKYFQRTIYLFIIYIYIYETCYFFLKNPWDFYF